MNVRKTDINSNYKFNATTSGDFVINKSSKTMNGKWRCESKVMNTDMDTTDYNLIYETQLTVQSSFH